MVVLTEKRTLLWVGPNSLPANVAAALSGQWDVCPCAGREAMAKHLTDAQVVLVSPDRSDLRDPRQLLRTLDEIDHSGAVAVVLVPSALAELQPLTHRHGQFVIADAGASPAELAARIETAADLQPAIRDLRADAGTGRTAGPTKAQNFQALEEEMRLAAHLQRDFLPRPVPQVGPIRFATLFRPASWVSGDFYDIFRLDETHVGFYVADVAGHGLPAALLTMYIKKALQTKRITGNSYHIVGPEDVLAQLNADLCEQKLSACQFCTAVYAIVDVQTLQLRYARGGHPWPLRLAPGGQVQRLQGSGPLLGIFPNATFEPRELTLAPGDRLVMFSDGVEQALASPAHSGPQGLTIELQRLRQASPEEMVLQLTARIDEVRAPDEHDDVTVMVMDVLDA